MEKKKRAERGAEIHTNSMKMQFRDSLAKSALAFQFRAVKQF